MLGSRDLGYRAVAEDLYRDLWEPLEAKLAGKTLIGVVPDGPSWNLPFAALMDKSNAYLIERAALYYPPSLAALEIGRAHV